MISQSPLLSVFMQGSKEATDIGNAIDVLLTASTESPLAVESKLGSAGSVLMAAYNTGVDKIVRSRNLSKDRYAFINFGLLDARLIAGRPEALALIESESEKGEASLDDIQIIPLWAFLDQICRGAIPTQAILDGHAGIKAFKAAPPDSGTALTAEIRTLIEIRKSSAMRGGVSVGHTPVLLEKWIGTPVTDHFNTREGIKGRLEYFQLLCPTLFKNPKGGKIDTTVIIFPGIGHSYGVAYSHRDISVGRIFVPLLNSRFGGGDISQLDQSLISGLGILYFTLLTPFGLVDLDPASFSGLYNTYCTKNADKDGELSTYWRFVKDLTLYLTHEARGTQKMSKDLRKLFWKFFPYSRDKREQLAKQATVFGELNRDLQNYYKKNGF